MRYDTRVQNTYWGPSSVHGVGVFAKTDLSPGETAEVCRYKFFRRATQHPLLVEEGNAHLILPLKSIDTAQWARTFQPVTRCSTTIPASPMLN